ncbi:MAG: polysaccharide biosynthesis/export family protein [Hyphomicrobiales bacterium]|nr:polysaccharide biosynthesis/export family protein [Hyphomicrobiales bacterium]MCP5373667.1 polysaccharide biosynthesis/export family protein [Hyphomicrobiales bacterium]
MSFLLIRKSGLKLLAIGLLALGAAACSSYQDAADVAPGKIESPNYRIGPQDNLKIFVWRNPELSTNVPVRPDGKISVPLIEDLQAANKTPTELARDIEKVLAQYVQNPIVTIIVTGFNGPFDQQVRVVGEASSPKAIPFREHMTVLDLMISVGGLTDFAAGNRAVILRNVDGKQETYRVRLDDLIKDGDVSANAAVLPGDVLIIPQAWF